MPDPASSSSTILNLLNNGNYSGTLFLTNDEECRRVVEILL